MAKKLFSHLWIYIVLFFIALPLILPFFHSGYFPTHDGEWAVVRLGDMFREIRDHQFPPRYSENLNFGYGYPLFNFAYPFPYYIGLLIHFLKFSFIDSIKIVFAGSTIISVWSMYLAAKAFWGNKWAGVISSVLYAYLPYRIVDLYARGSIGETVAFVFFPLICYFALQMYKHPQQKAYIACLSLSLTCLLLSHNIMALLFFPVFLLFIVVLAWRQWRTYITIYFSAIFFGFMGASFFWIPALAEKHLILLAQIPIADRSINFVSLWQLFFSPFGYGIPEAKTGGFTYQIGWPQILSFLVIGCFVIRSFIKKQKQDIQQTAAAVFLLAIFLMILMLFPFTTQIWKHLPLLKEINYPWTFLGPIGFLLSFTAGFIGTTKSLKVKIGGIILAIFAVVLYVPFAHPQLFTFHPDTYYLTNDATTTSSSEYTPLWVKQLPNQRPSEKVQIAPGSGAISSLAYNSKQVSFQATMGQYGGPVRINTIYYPGWKVFADAKQIPISYTNTYGVMDISLAPGVHTVVATFSETPFRFASDMLSLVGCVLIGVLFISSIFTRKIKS